MKISKFIFSAVAIACVAVACTKERKLSIQNPPVPGVDMPIGKDEAYYQKLREWKASDHTLTYVYYAAWAPLEGASSLYIEYQNLAPRLINLPDSLDIVNLWMGTPSNDPEDGYNYSPYAWSDMKYAQQVKGIKFVMHADASHYGQVVDLIDPDTFEFVIDDQTGKPKQVTVSANDAESIRAYARYNVYIVNKCGLDGVDYDYEGWGADQITTVIKETGRYFGAQADEELPGAYPEKLVIVDYWSATPPQTLKPYVDYVVRQAYSQQAGLNSHSQLGGPGWLAKSKYIICEQYNQGSGAQLNYLNGGKKWSDPAVNENGEEIYSLEAYARYCMKGQAKGFGAYYIDKDVDNGTDALRQKGYKGTFENYAFLRRAIQIANPAGAYTGEE